MLDDRYMKGRLAVPGLQHAGPYAQAAMTGTRNSATRTVHTGRSAEFAVFCVELLSGCKGGIEHGTDGAFTNSNRRRGGAYPARFGTGARRQVRLEAAREVDDIRTSRGYGCDDAVMDGHGDHEGRAGCGPHGRVDSEAGTEEDERRVSRGA